MQLPPCARLSRPPLSPPDPSLFKTSTPISCAPTFLALRPPYSPTLPLPSPRPPPSLVQLPLQEAHPLRQVVPLVRDCRQVCLQAAQTGGQRSVLVGNGGG